MHRWPGAVIAGGLFVLPGIVSIMALSVIYAAYGSMPVVTALFLGLKAAVLAIVLQAVQRVGSRALKSQSMLVLGDTTNHPWLFARNPDWHAIIDVDGAMAADTRKKLLDRAAADKMLVQGYHFPFPASGYITRRGTGYDVVPVMWQPAL